MRTHRTIALRVPLALTILFGTACRHNAPTLDSEFRDIQRLLSAEQYDTALPRAEVALTRAQASGEAKELWRFRLLEADILIGRRAAAKTLAAIEGFGDPPPGSDWDEVRAHLLLLRGRASYVLNRLPESEALLARAADLAAQAHSESLAAEVLLRQGALYVRQAKFNQARSAFSSVAATAARLQDEYQEANALGNMGYDLLSESRHDEAIPWFERAIAIFTGLGAGDSIARTHGNLGICYFRLGDYDNARLHYQNAEEWFAKTGNPASQQIWIGNAANVSYVTGDYAAAEAAYKRALEIARRAPNPVWTARWLDNLAATSIELGKWDAAESYNREALAKMRQLRDSNWEPTALVNAARIAEGRGNIEEARDLFRLALTKRAEDGSVALDAHSGLARCFLRDKRPRDAEAEFRSTVAAVEQRGARLFKNEQKLSYLSSLIQFYRQYVDFLVDSGETEKALEVAESSRAHVLAERLDAAAPVQHSAQDYRRLARRAHAVLLEYWLGPGKSYLWVVTPDSIRLHLLPPSTVLRPLIASYRAMVAGGRNPLESGADTGRTLYADLIAPAARSATGNRFIVVPDGELHSFPLDTLPSGTEPRRFWVEDATITIAPSLNYLAADSATANARAGKGALLIGEPVSSSPEFPRLEFAAQEMDSIAATMRAAPGAIIRGADATPASYSRSKPGRFGFIHLAAHATVNPQSPLDSAVILSGPPGLNRLLARDVMATPLSAELVTISACRSAGGKSYAGEGLVGFAWAFLRAGARNVIAGLWDVSDRSTAQLMSTLYERIAAGEDPAESLRSAKRALIHAGGSYAKPFYWAPFQLYTGAIQ